MRNFIQRFLSTGCLLLAVLFTMAQKQILAPVRRCETMEELNRLIRNNPGIVQQWKAEGDRQYNAYLKRSKNARVERVDAGPVIIPLVFHIVDSAFRQAWITDRDIYEQVEILNRDYSGSKADLYKNVIPAEITARIGRIPLKFVLARRAPDGTLTSGIERRASASPDHINIKYTASGGLDAWDSSRYVNVWCGTFSGSENGLLGIATFPFTTGGPQGVVIGTATLPFTSPTTRSYYPTYTEGATLSHELGHYFYLWHTFGDNASCNNDDFRTQQGWPLSDGAGPEGDDTPDQKGNPQTDGFVYGNPSQNYNVGCIQVPYGDVYGSFMNYFDDRALFMFTDGHRKRVESCIDLYRPGLKTTNGATPPVAVTDAFLVTVNPRGTPERRAQFINNTPFQAVVRNYGNSTLTHVTVTLQVDAAAAVATPFSLSLAPGTDTVLSLGLLTAAAGNHNLRLFTSLPNGGADTFTNNDTLYSYVTIQGGTITAPFTESFTATTFPPASWILWNPNGGTATWTRNGTAGFAAAGAASFNNFSINQTGTLDELITPAINFGTSDSSVLNFNVAHAVYDNVDVSSWDGLEVYVSGDGGSTYTRAYKKTGIFLKTIDAPQTTPFSATPAQPERWRQESVNLTPFIKAGRPMIIKFRNTNANGNNTFIDDISVSALSLPTRDAKAVSVSNIPPVLCGVSSFAPTFIFANNGKDTITSLTINYRVDNNAVTTLPYTGTLARTQSDQKILGTISGISPGSHVLTVYTSSPNGLADQNTFNDTLKISFTVLAPVQPPIREGFEGTTFPPANWILVKSNNAYSWERTTVASSEGVASAYIRNYQLKASGSKDDLYAPLVQLLAPDSVFLTFNVAHVTARYPGSTAVPLDTLEVLLTKDCGATFTSVYKKWGAELQTVGDPNFPVIFSATDTVGFVPSQPGLWRRDSVDLSPSLASSTGTFQLVFRNINNSGNNTYIDNVNITPLTLPAKLKAQGYLIAPNPGNGLVTIRYYMRPANLRGIQVINPAGQIIIQRTYNGNAISSIPLDLTRYANGVYSIRMVYDNKVVIDRIIKVR